MKQVKLYILENISTIRIFFHLALVAFKCFINVFDNTLLNDVH